MPSNDIALQDISISEKKYINILSYKTPNPQFRQDFCVLKTNLTELGDGSDTRTN